MGRTRGSRFAAALLASLAVPVLAAGCASQDGPATGQEPEPAVTATAGASIVPVDEAVEALRDGAVALDVRTPEEYASGHLVDAVNIDATAPDFEDRVADLRRDATYVVYCASGNRAGTAVARMRALGFTDVMNGGGFEDLAGAGVASTT